MKNVSMSEKTAERFTFEYVAYAVRIKYPNCHSAAEKRHCEVEIYKKDETARVFVTEDERGMSLRDRKLNFADIVFQLRQSGHFSKPRWIRECDVTWYKRTLLDEKGRDVLYRVHIGKWSEWTFRPRINFTREYEFGDFRVRDIRFFENQLLVIETGSLFKRKPWLLPLGMYPSLLKAGDAERKNYRLNHDRTVIYWPEIGERMFARDTILFGEPTQTKPAEVSDSQFIEQPITPRLL